MRVLAAWFDYIMFETIFDVLFKMLNTLLIRWLHMPYIVWNVDVLIISSLFFWFVINRMGHFESYKCFSRRIAAC